MSDKYGAEYDVLALRIMLSGESQKKKDAKLAKLAAQAERHVVNAADCGSYELEEEAS